MVNRRNKAPTAGGIDDVRLVRTSALCNGEMATYLWGGDPSHYPSANAWSYLPDDLSVVKDQLFALNDLQHSRNKPIDNLSLEYSILSVYHSLPQEVQAQICFVAPTPDDLVFGIDDAASAAAIDKRYAKRGIRRRKVFHGIRNSEYLFWPINAEGTGERWVTLVAHLIQTDGDEFDTVTDLAVVDASRHPAATVRIDRVVARALKIFNHGDITVQPQARRQLWVPRQSENQGWESGIRSFQLVRQLFLRITDYFCTNITFDDDHFFEGTSGWLNVDFIRHEMIGMAEERCNDRLNYACRYALEPIQDIILDGSDPFEPSCLAPSDNSNRAYMPDFNEEDGGENEPGVDHDEDEDGDEAEAEDAQRRAAANERHTDNGELDGNDTGRPRKSPERSLKRKRSSSPQENASNKRRKLE